MHIHYYLSFKTFDSSKWPNLGFENNCSYQFGGFKSPDQKEKEQGGTFSCLPGGHFEAQSSHLGYTYLTSQCRKLSLACIKGSG